MNITTLKFSAILIIKIAITIMITFYMNSREAIKDKQEKLRTCK